MLEVPHRQNNKPNKSKIYKITKAHFFLIAIGAFFCGALFFATTYYLALSSNLFGLAYQLSQEIRFIAPPRFNVTDYNKRMLLLANNATSTAISSASTTANLWPVKTVYPKVGAILPFYRVVAYYGNFLSTKMGVLGQYPTDEMLERLAAEVQKWQEADPSTPVMPAIDYIAITAQGSAGADGKYRARMPDSQIDHALDLANRVNGIVILDVQVGQSNLQTELPLLEKYLKMPQVHLAVDPEFAMKNGDRPGRVIGTLDASDINYAANYLASLVKQNHLPPKILIVHRFTRPMVTNYKQIAPLPEVQIVMDMDGWGAPSRKLGTYKAVVHDEPIQFAGFKLFYKNDILPPSTHMLTPSEVLKLSPRPIFIQYQ